MHLGIDYYNPNIDSKEEYEKRVHEQQRLVSEMNLPIKVIDAGYAPQTFFWTSIIHFK